MFPFERKGELTHVRFAHPISTTAKAVPGFIIIIF